MYSANNLFENGADINANLDVFNFFFFFFDMLVPTRCLKLYANNRTCVNKDLKTFLDEKRWLMRSEHRILQKTTEK